MRQLNLSFILEGKLYAVPFEITEHCEDKARKREYDEEDGKQHDGDVELVHGLGIKQVPCTPGLMF